MAALSSGVQAAARPFAQRLALPEKCIRFGGVHVHVLYARRTDILVAELMALLEICCVHPACVTMAPIG